MIRTFPCGFENDHACKGISENFLGMLKYVLFLKIVRNSIACMLVLQSKGKGTFSSCKYGTNLSPRFDTLKRIQGLKAKLCVKNCHTKMLLCIFCKKFFKCYFFFFLYFDPASCSAAVQLAVQLPYRVVWLPYGIQGCSDAVQGC